MWARSAGFHFQMALLFFLPVTSSTILPCFDLCVHIHHVNHSIHPLYWGFQSWTWSINKLLYCLILLFVFFTNCCNSPSDCIDVHFWPEKNQHTIVDQFSSFMTRWDFAFCQSILWRMVILVSFGLFTAFSFIPPQKKNQQNTTGCWFFNFQTHWNVAFYDSFSC